MPHSDDGPIPDSDRTTHLRRLAEAYGISSSYEDWRRRRRAVPDATLVAVLAVLGVDAENPDAASTALAAVDEAPWRRMLPPSHVAVDGDTDSWSFPAYIPAGAEVTMQLWLEDGAPVAVPHLGPAGPARELDGTFRTERRVALPPDLPHGYHALHLLLGEGPHGGGSARAAECTLIVAPAGCPRPTWEGQAWGWMVQLYAIRSQDSWGIGDLADLAELCRWSGQDLGADFVVCNPLHAVTPMPPLEPSPYYPTSRRFWNPLYLRLEDLPEYAAADEATRAAVDRLGARQREENRSDRIDRDAAWEAKRAALQLLHPLVAAAGRSEALRSHREQWAGALDDFALFCALAERHGSDWQTWPRELRRPDGPAVAAARTELAESIDFHGWLQSCCDAQLAGAQRAAREAGMAIGVVHDLAVGVDPGGADGWALQQDLALGVTIGAPPDAFNQQGQNWRLPPLRPDRLAATGFLPFRQIIASVLRHAGGIRMDHVMGLFRLWWVPDGLDAAEGAYVRYPARELLAVLALEVERSGAVVVGEDLGTVQDEVRAALARAGVFGSRVVYFERTPPDDADPDRLRRASEYPAQVLASVTTHDLPTAAGWWMDEDVRVQSELGLLGSDTNPERERERKAAEHAEMEQLLRAEGLLGARPTLSERVFALHALLARTPARLVAVAPGDAVGDPRQPNMPGTVDEYPNWRLPVAEPTGDGARPLTLEDLQAHAGVRRLAKVLSRRQAGKR